MIADGTTIRLRVADEKMGLIQVIAKVPPEVIEEIGASGNMAAACVTIGHTLFAAAANEYPDEMKPILKELSKLTGMEEEEAAEVEIGPPINPRPRRKIITA